MDRHVLSPANAGSGSFRGRDPLVTLAALAHPGLLSGAAPRLVDRESKVELMVTSFYLLFWRCCRTIVGPERGERVSQLD